MQVLSDFERKEGGKDQESMQSSTTKPFEPVHEILVCTARV